MTTGEVVVGLLVAVAVLASTRRSSAAPRVGSRRRGSARTGTGRSGAVRRLWAPGRRSRRAAPTEPDVAHVVTEVAARLRAGSPVADAWRRSTGGPHEGGTSAPAADRWLADARARTRDQRVRAQLDAVGAACRLADRLGAPLAEVLERSADGVVEVAQAEGSLRVALAGPASTARLLAWLPVAGVALGWALGADPLATLLDGGVGTVAGVLGVALALAGRRWSRALVESARRDPSAGHADDRAAGRRFAGDRPSAAR